MTGNLKTTLKAWPVIAAVTIGLCFLTQTTAKLFGVDLPDQHNVDVVRQWLLHAFDSAGHFWTCAFLLFQVLILLPAVEEAIFRFLLVGLPAKSAAKAHDVKPPAAGGFRLGRIGWIAAVVSSVLFSAAHYIAQPFPDSAFAALFFFGLAQCVLYAKTGRVWCAMLNHTLFNLTNLVLLLIVPQ